SPFNARLLTCGPTVTASSTVTSGVRVSAAASRPDTDTAYLVCDPTNGPRGRTSTWALAVAPRGTSRTGGSTCTCARGGSTRASSVSVSGVWPWLATVSRSLALVSWVIDAVRRFATSIVSRPVPRPATTPYRRSSACTVNGCSADVGGASSGGRNTMSDSARSPAARSNTGGSACDQVAARLRATDSRTDRGALD